jgi:hypothetical protein
VTLELSDGTNRRRFKLGDDFKVAVGAGLLAEIELLLGRGSMAQAA